MRQDFTASDGSKVSISVLDGFLYLHDFEGNGAGHEAIFKARTAAREMGFSEWRMWVDPMNSAMMETMKSLGYGLEQVLFRGAI